MIQLLLIRHGHVEGISPERFRGRADLALTEHGRGQARAVALRVAAGWRPTAIYTSPMQRCIATATAISEACDVPWQVLNELNDIDYGEWQFMSYQEAEATDPALFASWFAAPHLVRFPKGDSLQDLVARSADALRFILEHQSNATVIAVAHDSVNRALLLQLLDQPLSSYWRLAQDPCCINAIQIVDRRVRVGCINETSHLCSLESG